MYNVSAISLQNIYSPSAVTKSSSKNDFSAAIDAVFAPSAAEKYVQTSGIEITADNLYATLVERAKTSSEKLAEYDFSDMYVTSTAHQNVFSESQRNALKRGANFGNMLNQLSDQEQKAIKDAGCFHVPVPIGAGELPRFMDDIMQALSEGMSLTDALDSKIKEFMRNNSIDLVSNSWTDCFFVNPANGDVVVQWTKSRIQKNGEYDGYFSDVDAALELADDLATFLRYAAFAQEDDDSERVEALFSYIKNKQAYANYDRYIFDQCPEATPGDTVAKQIIANLTAAGVLKGEDDEEEEEEAIDALMEAIKEHQEALREDMIDREKSELIIAEIEEILYSMA